MWKADRSVEQLRRDFLEAYALDPDVPALCERFGIKETCGYDLIKRSGVFGVETAVAGFSRAPLSTPTKTTAAVVSRVLELRAQHPKWGGHTLHQLLVDEGCKAPPKPSTIANIIKEHGLARPHRRRHGRSKPLSKTVAVRPNDVWAVDFKGRMARLGLEPLSVIDEATRFLICCDPFADKSCAGTRARFVQLFAEFGMPTVIRVDAGQPWQSASISGLTKLSAWWISLGIRVERVSSPQENGRVERYHGTLEREADVEGVVDVREHFERFRHCYNHERPHRALAMLRPAALYRPSTKQSVELVPNYDECDKTRVVGNRGGVLLDDKSYFVSEALVGRRVGLRRLTRDEWDVRFHHLRVGVLNVVTGELRAS